MTLLNLLPRSLLLPPLDLLVLALGGLLLARRFPRAARRVVQLGLLALLVLAMPIVPRLVLQPLENGIALRMPAAGTAAPPAAIVILSGDSVTGTADGAILPGAHIGGFTLERVLAGATLQARTGLPILVTGGVSGRGQAPLATMMAETLQQSFRTPVRWIEPASRDTWQNAEFSAAILARAGISAAYVVSSSWHLRRARIAFRHFGITVWPAPIDRDRFGRIAWSDFIPSVYAWMDSYYAMHEWAGCAVYALRS